MIQRHLAYIRRLLTNTATDTLVSDFVLSRIHSSPSRKVQLQKSEDKRL